MGDEQLEMGFDNSAGDAGYSAWVDERREAMRRLARSLGMPLNKQVEVWLRGGIRLRGLLLLKEEKLFLEDQRDSKLELEVDHVVFTPAEVESCVRLD